MWKRKFRAAALCLAAGVLLLGGTACDGQPADSSAAPSSPGSETTAPSTTAKPDKNVLFGVDYDADSDAFYDKKEHYITWLNVWNGSSEYWWAQRAATNSYYGTKVLVDGEYVCFDSMNEKHRLAMFQQAKDAGIDVLVMDLTNGHSGWGTPSKGYQKLCFENNMKFAAAVHPTSAQHMEEICAFIWKSYAAPGTALYSSAYMYKNGKPVLVLYCSPGEFEAASASTGEYRQKFEVVWASGEDSKADKWGWQIVPQDGPMLSGDSMFVTPSIAWNSPQGSAGSWRKSLAMLDFCFLARNEAKPTYTIVGSIDDMSERNGWAIMDTTNAVQQSQDGPGKPVVESMGDGLQMRDINGNISFDAYYNRVKSWIAGEAKAYNAGGVIPDGAYTITGASSGKQFGVIRPKVRSENDIGAAFVQDTYLYTDMESYYWFYHLGNDEYRIVKLTSGLSLQPGGEELIQQWTDAVEEQRWLIKKLDNGSYTLVNKKTGQAIADAAQTQGNIRVLPADAGSAQQQWRLEPVANRIME